uniref:Uncharacterized protein n=2 Tax=Cupriavidus TaxID=106589 RepID=Q46MB7_CUPPJ
MPYQDQNIQMNRMSKATSIAIASLLSACAIIPRQTWQDRAELAVQDKIKKEEYFEAARALVDLDKSMPERTGDLWAKVAKQNVKKTLYAQGSDYMARTTEFSEPGIQQTLKTISTIEVRGFVTPEEAETLRKSLANRARPEMVAGNYVYSTTLIGALYGEQRQELNTERYFTIKKRVVEAQFTKPFPPNSYVAEVEAMADIAAEESPRGKIYKDFAVTLPTLRLTPSQASTGAVARNFGPEAEQSLAKRRGKIHLQIFPEDPLLQADLSAALGKKLPLAQFVDSATGAIPVVVKKLRHEERVQPERTETVTVAQYNVNIVAAALLMPRNASYLYDKRTGGISLEYAYEIKGSSPICVTV